MLDKNLINKRLYESWNELRLIGNEAAHGIRVASSAQDARDGLDFTIGIIDYPLSYQDQV
jgi:hypothetical protein